MNDNVVAAKPATDKGKLTGEITLIARDKDGNIKEERKVKNLIMNTGMAAVASRINGDGSEALFNYLAVGITNTAPAATQTTLASEVVTVGLERAVATLSRDNTGGVTNDTAVLDKTWTVTGAGATVVEAGAFNAASAGVMLGRQIFGAIVLVATDTLQVIYKFSIS